MQSARRSRASMGEAEARCVERFLDHLSVERRLSPRTIEAYREDLGKLVAALPDSAWRDVSPEHIRSFIAQQHRDGLSGVSLKRRLSAIRSFYRWLMREGLAHANPADAIRAPKSGRKLPHVLDADEMNALLE